MFPYSYHSDIVIQSEESIKISPTVLIEKFNTLFDSPKSTSKNTLEFDGFNVFIKRHGWLDGGSLKIKVTDHQVIATLRLDFYFRTVLFTLLSVGMLIASLTSFAFFSIVALWTVHLLTYLWTVTMYKMNIRSVIQKQLVSKQEETHSLHLISETCPACNNKIKSNDTVCSDCGLVLNNP